MTRPDQTKIKTWQDQIELRQRHDKTTELRQRHDKIELRSRWKRQDNLLHTAFILRNVIRACVTWKKPAADYEMKETDI